MESDISPLLEIHGGMTSKVREIVETKINLSKSECAPHIADGRGTCFSPAALAHIRSWLQLPESRPQIIIEAAKEKTGCNTEACLLKSPMLELSKSEALRFKPEGPKDASWLSNKNIDQILRRWTLAKPGFCHVPFQMIDFQTYGGELALVDWKSFIAEYKWLGCVINTDHKGGKGKHWECVFVDTVGHTVEFFDSASNEVSPEITKWLVESALELSRVSKQKYRDVVVTSMEHQRSESECGVYALFYILSRLSGVPYQFFERTRVPDKDMEEFREYLFL